MVPIERKDDENYIVVGDLHGCFEVLITLFEGNKKNNVDAVGYPGDVVNGKKNIYIFNGDLIDRGGSGYQIVYFLCLLAVQTKCVYVNRGNHETEYVGLSQDPFVGYGFMVELEDKFPKYDR